MSSFLASAQARRRFASEKPLRSDIVQIMLDEIEARNRESERKTERKRISAIGLKHRLAVMAPAKLFADNGTLLSYGPDYPTLWHRGAYFIDKQPSPGREPRLRRRKSGKPDDAGW